ncbi:MAG: ATP-binding protein [Clostridia bacterium]|nr:ATP-binding protein [Clostridia bacterium]
MKEMTLEAKIENIPRVTAFIDEQLEALDCSMKAQMQIDVAIDELFGNISHYAYVPGTGEATVGFDFDEETRTVSVIFSDRGVPFDPLVRIDPDISAPAQERAIGGLGIFLVKKTMDSLEYRYEDGKNVLTIKKKI